MLCTNSHIDANLDPWSRFEDCLRAEINHESYSAHASQSLGLEGTTENPQPSNSGLLLSAAGDVDSWSNFISGNSQPQAIVAGQANDLSTDNQLSDCFSRASTIGDVDAWSNFITTDYQPQTTNDTASSLDTVIPRSEPLQPGIIGDVDSWSQFKTQDGKCQDSLLRQAGLNSSPTRASLDYLLQDNTLPAGDVDSWSHFQSSVVESHPVIGDFSWVLANYTMERLNSAGSLYPDAADVDSWSNFLASSYGSESAVLRSTSQQLPLNPGSIDNSPPHNKIPLHLEAAGDVDSWTSFQDMLDVPQQATSNDNSWSISALGDL
jgi:hypothetical protein